MERKEMQKEESKKKNRIYNDYSRVVVGRGKKELIQLCCQLFMLIARVK
jgi:hypothetical protein